MQRGITVTTAALILTSAWLLAYGPTVPGGFIKDDFGWVYHSRLDGWNTVYQTFDRADGFYRPLVQLSFGITEAFFDNNPVPYALTNVALALACAVAIYMLGIALGLPPWAAVLAAAVWAFNFHGINMAVAWLSGRTSLVATLFATLSALYLMRRRPVLAGLLCFASLLSKEEVLALPLILVAWQWLDEAPVRSTLPAWIALAVYLVLREHSGAFGISDAPSFYRFSTDPSLLAKNLIEYADRSMTFGLLVLVAAMSVVRRLPVIGKEDRSRIIKGTIWLVCGFSLTLWLPVRSSLYVVFPSVGFAIATASIVRCVVAMAPAPAQLRLAAAALLLPFILLPVYWSRNVRWTELRALTDKTFKAIQAEPLTGRTLVVLEDDLTTRANFRNAFGTMFPEAARLFLRGEVQLWIDPPPPELADSAASRPRADRVRTFRLRDGRIELRTDAARASSSSRLVRTLQLTPRWRSAAPKLGVCNGHSWVDPVRSGRRRYCQATHAG